MGDTLRDTDRFPRVSPTADAERTTMLMRAIWYQLEHVDCWAFETIVDILELIDTICIFLNFIFDFFINIYICFVFIFIYIFIYFCIWISNLYFVFCFWIPFLYFGFGIYTWNYLQVREMFLDFGGREGG